MARFPGRVVSPPGDRIVFLFLFHCRIQITVYLIFHFKSSRMARERAKKFPLTRGRFHTPKNALFGITKLKGSPAPRRPLHVLTLNSLHDVGTVKYKHQNEQGGVMEPGAFFYGQHFFIIREVVGNDMWINRSRRSGLAVNPLLPLLYLSPVQPPVFPEAPPWAAVVPLQFLVCVSMSETMVACLQTFFTPSFPAPGAQNTLDTFSIFYTFYILSPTHRCFVLPGYFSPLHHIVPYNSLDKNTYRWPTIEKPIPSLDDGAGEMADGVKSISIEEKYGPPKPRHIKPALSHANVHLKYPGVSPGACASTKRCRETNINRCTGPGAFCLSRHSRAGALFLLTMLLILYRLNNEPAETVEGADGNEFFCSFFLGAALHGLFFFRPVYRRKRKRVWLKPRG